MALWLERRDEKGQLVGRGQFFDGSVMLSGPDLSFTIPQARELAKISGHLPLEQRDWALRISFDE